MELSKERIREIGAALREWVEYGRDNTIYKSVTIEQDDYYFDLGQFGEQSTSVSVEDDEYEIDPGEVLRDFPFGFTGFEEFAAELEEYEEPFKEATLDSVLTSMENNGQGALVRAVRAVVELFENVMVENSIVAAAIPNMNGLSVGPLPPSPIPWPGALRPEIDYTAADFPMRYQPPPGYDWSRVGNYSSSVRYDNAEKVEVETLQNQSGAIFLDEKGRVTWDRSNNRLDSFESGSRWVMWYLERAGMPPAGGFNSDTWPRALTTDGETLSYPEVATANPEQLDDSRMWGGYEAATNGRQRARAIRQAYEDSIVVPSPEGAPSGVGYDPLTVEVADRSDPDGIRTEDLRLGDDVTGDDFGRVLSVTKEDDSYVITMNRDGQINTERTYGNGMRWDVLPIVGVDRDAQPTAVSLTAWAPGDVTEYDPLTVNLVPDEVLVASRDLRPGDDILGGSFGRVVRIENDEIVMNRDGQLNRTKYGEQFKWQVKVIDVPDRDSLPTAASLQPAAF